MTLLFDFLLVCGLLFSGIILVLLWHQKEKGLPNRLLMVIFGGVLIETLHFYGTFHEVVILEVLTYPFDNLLAFWLGPVLLLYVKSLYQPADGLVKTHWPHFVFGLLYAGLVTIPTMISLLFLDGPLFEYLRWIIKSDWFYLIQMTFLLPYALWSLRLLERYRGIVKDNFSELDTYGFDWVRHFFWGLIGVIGIDLATSFYEISFGNLTWNTGNLTIAVLVVLVGYLGVHGVSQSRVLLPVFLLERTTEVLSSTVVPVTPQPAPLPEAAELEQRLVIVLTEEEAYLDESLTLGKLAALLPCTDKKLSLLLNQHLGTSFYDLVNQHRLAAVCESMAADPFGNRLNIEIAYACGFNSKTSFNRIFKKQLNMTPSAYRIALAQKA